MAKKTIKARIKGRMAKEMVSKAFRKCVELVEEMLSKGFRLQISQTEVERLIKIGIGADKRTVQKYLKMLTEDLGFLKTAAKNPFGTAIYTIDVPAIEQFVSQHMKEKLRQLRLSDIRLKQDEEVKGVNIQAPL
jgi:demethoxyubiquinone hydroxylase (CLK1/Coq7/Cat5 family)